MSQQTDADREAFEAWVQRTFSDSLYYRVRRSSEDGAYYSPEVNLMWTTWQAALAWERSRKGEEDAE